MRMTTQLRFEPQDVTITVDETVTWVNGNAIPHSATDNHAQSPVAATYPELTRLPPEAPPWGSVLLGQGLAFPYTFAMPGEYKYDGIMYVLSGMRGTITVEG